MGQEITVGADFLAVGHRGQRVIAAASDSQEAVGAPLRAFEAFGAPVLPAARAAPHAGVRRGEAVGIRREAFVARSRVHVRHEDNAVPKFASEPINPAVSSLCDLPPAKFARGLTGAGDVGSDLRDVGGVLPQGGFDNRDSFADAAEEVLAAVEFGLSALRPPAWSQY